VTRFAFFFFLWSSDRHSSLFSIRSSVSGFLFSLAESPCLISFFPPPGTKNLPFFQARGGKIHFPGCRGGSLLFLLKMVRVPAWFSPLSGRPGVFSETCFSCYSTFFSGKEPQSSFSLLKPSCSFFFFSLFFFFFEGFLSFFWDGLFRKLPPTRFCEVGFFPFIRFFFIATSVFPLSFPEAKECFLSKEIPERLCFPLLSFWFFLSSRFNCSFFSARFLRCRGACPLYFLTFAVVVPPFFLPLLFPLPPGVFSSTGFF